jgi:hypothetical protein
VSRVFVPYRGAVRQGCVREILSEANFSMFDAMLEFVSADWQCQYGSRPKCCAGEFRSHTRVPLSRNCQ